MFFSCVLVDAKDSGESCENKDKSYGQGARSEYAGGSVHCVDGEWAVAHYGAKPVMSCG